MNVAIHETVLLGKGAVVWNFATVCANTVIGDGSVVGSCAWIGKNCRIGSGVRIQHGAFIPNGSILEDDVFIGPNVVFTDDKYPKSGNREYRASPPIVRKGASIGAGATILPGVEIGLGAMVAAGAVVTRNVPGNITVIGVPAYVAA